jgi:5-methyltetrahydropteroyltriglutamate--homocysteine methyltransferase
MTIQTTVVGSYPKPPDEGQPFVVRTTLHKLERGEATVDDLKAAQDDLARTIIKEQEDAGTDIVTDGHARWEDILTPFARHIGGFEIGGLLRWFDNNVYFRRPIATGKVDWRGPSTVEDFRFAQAATDRTVKAVIPGPITFARLSIDEYYADHEKYVEALAKVLAQEAFELEAAGAKLIQIDEPALLDAPEDLELAKRAIGIIANELRSDETKTILATYFGDAKRLGAELFDIPVDGYGFDLVSGPENRNLIEQVPDGKKVQAGIVDARNTKLERVDELRATIDALASVVGEDRLLVSPSAGLEFLPREKARAKLQRLGAAVKTGGAA